MKEFIKDYILSQIETTPSGNEIKILNKLEQTSENFGYSYVQTKDNVVFYANSENGIMFYVYDKFFNLVKTEELTTNHLRIVGETLKVDEDGRFYMVGYVTPENSSTEVYALVLLNDLNKNIAQIRKYYKLSDYGINQTVKDCQKREGSADYLFVYEKERIVDSTHYFDLTFVQLTISVQSGNSSTTWTFQAYLVNRSTYGAFLGIGYQFNQETSKILIVNYGDTDFNRRVTLINLGEWNLNGATYLTNGNGIDLDKMINTEINKSKTKNIFDADKTLLETTKNLINNCIFNVCNGNFKISPIKIENKKDGCKYCDYKDICFVKNKDFNLQVIKKGDDNNE